MNLAGLKPGETGRIVSIGSIGPMKRRLMDMGLLVGEEVTVEKVAPLGDPIEVRIKSYSVKAGTYILAVTVFVWFLLNLPWGVESRKDSYLGQAGQVIAPAFAPLGFGTWEAASSLVTDVIAKEIVVGTMGEIYAPTKEQEQKETPTLSEDLKEIGISFGKAVKDSISNVVSTAGISSLSTEEKSERSALKMEVRKAFTPLSAYAFMLFVLLYMPCMVVAIAMRQEFGSWKWFGVAFVYQTILAWGAAFIVYQGGRLLGLGG